MESTWILIRMGEPLNQKWFQSNVTSLVWLLELFLRWLVPAPLISIHTRFQSTNCYIYKITHIIQTPILSMQYLKTCVKLQAICQEKVTKIVVYHRLIAKFPKHFYIFSSSCLCNFCKGTTATECIWCR